VTDNQTGFVQVGLELPVVAAGGAKTAIAPTGFTYRATPRVMPDGRLLLRAEAQITEKGHTGVLTTAPGSSISAAKFVPCFNTQSVQTTTELKPGETVVIQVGETLVIVTPTVVK
jgi:type II secretory pathway component HofQ